MSLSDGADNIGDYQQDLGRRLAAALERGQTILIYVIYVDPDQPSDAIVDRELRWGLLGFKAIFVLVFGGVGAGLLAWAALSKRGSKAVLEARQDGMSVKTVRRILGIPVRQREMRQADFAAFDKTSWTQSQSGGRHVMHYSVYAVDHTGNRMLVGEGFRGAGQADAAIRLLSREFGLRPAPAFPAESLMDDGPDVTFAQS